MCARGSATTCAAANATRFHARARARRGVHVASPRSVYAGERAVGVAEATVRPWPTSAVERRNVEHAPLGPASQPELGELHALRAFEQVPAERSAVDDVRRKSSHSTLNALSYTRLAGIFCHVL